MIEGKDLPGGKDCDLHAIRSIEGDVPGHHLCPFGVPNDDGDVICSLLQELRDNIVQLYLLLVHNYYKNQFYLKLQRVTGWRWLLALICPLFVWVVRALP